MTDYARLLQALKNGTLDAAGFSHRDHIGVAFQALTQHGFFQAAEIVASGISGAADRAGATGKFHATITLAYMSLIAERMAQGRYDNAHAFIDAHPELTSGAALRDLYSRDRLSSEQARRIGLLPDRPASR